MSQSKYQNQDQEDNEELYILIDVFSATLRLLSPEKLKELHQILTKKYEDEEESLSLFIDGLIQTVEEHPNYPA